MAERGYKNIRTVDEELTEFSYRPGNCGRDYRVVALRKDLHVDRPGRAVQHLPLLLLHHQRPPSHRPRR